MDLNTISLGVRYLYYADHLLGADNGQIPRAQGAIKGCNGFFNGKVDLADNAYLTTQGNITNNGDIDLPT
ncbi:MAG: hypothetical protein KAR31_10700 [Candidatus Omnitrophica bacterium]|nr:hypothetical protein [Candidatus Omnitrophota bacterium]